MLRINAMKKEKKPGSQETAHWVIGSRVEHTWQHPPLCQMSAQGWEEQMGKRQQGTKPEPKHTQHQTEGQRAASTEQGKQVFNLAFFIVMDNSLLYVPKDR